MQQEFRIPESTVDRLIKKQMLIAVPVLAVSVGFGTFMAFYATGKLPSLAYILPICLLAVSIVSFVVYRGLRRQKNELKSFHLTINDHRLIRIQKNSPAVHLNRSEIKSVQKNRSGQKRDSIRDFIKQNYVGDKLVLSIVGNISNTRAENLARAYLEKIELPKKQGPKSVQNRNSAISGKHLIRILRRRTA